jgi:hypothetical protein
MCSNYNVSWKTGSILLFPSAALLIAAGGAPQLQRQVGAFVIGVSTTPAPLEVGSDHLTVTVQRLKDASLVPDADVVLHFRKSDPSNILEVMARAKPATISNKPAYAAEVTLPSTGSWNLSVEVTVRQEAAAFSANVDVLPRGQYALPHWPYFVLLPLFALLLIWIRWLKRARRLRRSQAPP